MNSFDLEDNIISCILQKNELINELFIDDIAFQNPDNRAMLKFFKNFYKEHNTLDLTLIGSTIKNQQSLQKFVTYVGERMNLGGFPALFYEYQEQLIDIYKSKCIENLIDNFKQQKLTENELVEKIIETNNQNLMLSNNHNKISPEEMIKKIRNKDKNISFDRLWRMGAKLKIKTHTVNVIAARPSEGKSALALNIFLDLSKQYKTLFFNLEMTEEEVYERMLGIESNLAIEDIIKPQTEIQDKTVLETARNIYKMNYEIVNGSKSLKSIKSKIIKEQREEHLIVFIDYVGYVKNKPNQNDHERVGEIVREMNDITKDYNCTIFLVAQINRSGADKPSMNDLKDTGELEQTADTIMLIHDEHPEVNNTEKHILIIVPKCRGGKRNVALKVRYDKTRQRMDLEE